MKCISFIIVWFLLFSGTPNQQRLICKQVKISFFSKAPLENIEAHTNSGLAVWDVSTKRIEFSVLVKGFEFKKALMQKHFNENYLETDQYPKATFKGNINSTQKIAFDTDGQYTVQVSGNLTLHGVTKPITAPATIVVLKKQVRADAVFTLMLSDYKISIPAIVKDNISKSVQVHVAVPVFEIR